MVALPCHLIGQHTRPGYVGAWQPTNNGRNCHKNCHNTHGHVGNQTVTQGTTTRITAAYRFPTWSFGRLLSPLCLPIPPPGPDARNVTQRKDLRKFVAPRLLS